MTVTVKTRERNRPYSDDANRGFPHDVTFNRWQSTATLRYVAYVDNEIEEGTDSLEAAVTEVGMGYEIENSTAVMVEINDPPSSSVIIDISANSDMVDEGDVAIFTLSRSGDLSSDVTVNITYEDVFEVLRGNHWDPPPDLLTAATIPAGVTTLDIAIPVPDDQRDVPGNPKLIWLFVEPSDDYLLGGFALDTWANTSVRDNDTAQELEFYWGYFSEKTKTNPPGRTGEEWI